MLKIKSIRLAGFRGVLAPLSIPCGTGFTVICGRNGTGKSTICDAIDFALTGNIGRYKSEETERGEYISNYIWWRDANTPTEKYAEIEFIDSDGNKYSIRRSPAGVTDEATAKLLYDESSAPQNALSQLCLTAIIRDEMITTFSTDLSETKRFDFVKKAIGLADSVAIEIKTHDVLEILKKVSSGVEAEYYKHRERISVLTSDLSEAQIQAARASEKDIARIQEVYGTDTSGESTGLARLAQEIAARLSGLRHRLDDVESLSREKTELDSLATQVDVEKIKARRLQLERQIAQVQEQLAPLDEQRIKLKQALRVLEEQSPRQTSLAQLREHGSRIGLQDDRCPLCGSRISAQDFEEHLGGIDAELKRAGQLFSEQTKADAQVNDEWTRKTKELALLKHDHGGLEKSNEKIALRMEQLRLAASDIQIAPSSEGLSAELSRLRQDIKHLEMDRDILGSLMAIHRLTELEEKLADAKGEAEKAEKELSRMGRAMGLASEAVDSARRISAEILDERLARLKPLFSELYHRFRPHSKWTEAEFVMRGDVQRFLSMKVGPDLNPRFMFSSGQRRALGLAFLMAVHLTRKWCNLQSMILDDPVQHVDDYRALHLVETLAAMRNEGRQIICTVEDPAMADLLCRRLRSQGDPEGIRVDMRYVAGEGIKIASIKTLSPLSTNVLSVA